MITKAKREIPWVLFAIIGFALNWAYWGDEFFRPAITTYHDETRTTNETGQNKTYFAPGETVYVRGRSDIHRPCEREWHRVLVFPNGERREQTRGGGNRHTVGESKPVIEIKTYKSWPQGRYRLESHGDFDCIAPFPKQRHRGFTVPFWLQKP